MDDSSRRGRRRAVRTAGPPPQATETDVRVALDKGGSGAATVGANAEPAVGADAAATLAPSEAGSEATGSDAPAAQSSAVSEQSAAAARGSRESDSPRIPRPRRRKAADSDGGPDATPQPRRRGALLGSAVSVLVVALVVAAGVLVWLDYAHRDDEQRRDRYVQTARQTALNLTTVRAASAKNDIDRILAGASGEFKSEFDGRVDPFRSVVEEAKVTSEGQIIEAALEKEFGDQATVLVAAKATVANAGQAEPEARLFRFRITVTDDGHRMTASKVEFVA